jgi:hypothetical protein
MIFAQKAEWQRKLKHELLLLVLMPTLNIIIM